MKRFFQGNSFQKFLFHDVMVVKLRVLEHRVAVWRRFGRSYYRTRQTSYRVVTELLPSCYRVVAVRPLVDSFDCYGRNKSIGWPVCVCVCVCCRVCWPFGLLPFVFFFVSCVCVCVCVCVAFYSWGAERCPFRAGGTPWKPGADGPAGPGRSPCRRYVPRFEMSQFITRHRVQKPTFPTNPTFPHTHTRTHWNEQEGKSEGQGSGDWKMKQENNRISEITKLQIGTEGTKKLASASFHYIRH